MLIKKEKTLASFLNDAIKNKLVTYNEGNYHAISNYWFNVNGGFGKTISDNLCQYIGASLSIVKMQ